MMSTQIERALAAILEREGLADPSWVASLSEHDEPPLFSRSEEVEFLRQLPEAERGPILASWAVRALDQIAGFLEDQVDSGGYFVCLTFMDWDMFDDGGQVLPTPSLFVSPNAEYELRDLRLQPSVSREARLVESWFSGLKRPDLCTGEALTRPDDEPWRVYVGYRQTRPFRSVGEYLSGTTGPSPTRI